MTPRPGTRGALPSTISGMGQHFTSPKRREVVIPGQDAKRQRLRQRLDDLLNRKLPAMPPPPVTNDSLLDAVIEDATGNTDSIQHVDDDVNEEIHHKSTPSVATS